MRWVPAGSFGMGSGDFYPEEAPVHRVDLDGFWIDEHPVTVAEFRRFTTAAGHVTCAERAPDPRDYPGADPSLLVPGSLVFTPPSRPVDLRNWGEWWTFLKGADWRHPYGPKSSINNLDNHPVVHVSFADALAYASWAGGPVGICGAWRARRSDLHLGR